MPQKYYHTKESVDEYIELAKDVNGNFIIEKFKGFLAEESDLLELGSGPGTDFEILKNTYNVIGSDYSEVFIEYLSNKFPKDKFLKIDASKIVTENKFDGIYSNKVIIHLNHKELELSVKSQANILNKNGLICHSFWKGEGDEIFKGMFVNYQTHDSLKDLFSSAFDILLIESYKEFEEDDSLILIGRKK